MTKKQKQKTTTTVNPCITCKYKSMKIYCSLMKLLSSVHQEEKQSGARLFVSGENQIRDQWANNHDIKDVNKGFDVFQPINKSGQSAYDVLSQRSTEEGRSGGVSDEKTWHTSHHITWWTGAGCDLHVCVLQGRKRGDDSTYTVRASSSQEGSLLVAEARKWPQRHLRHFPLMMRCKTTIRNPIRSTCRNSNWMLQEPL